TVIADFKVEYAKSKQSKCRLCESFIDKDVVRISKKNYDSDNAKRFGPMDDWHHLDCFVANRETLSFYVSGQLIPGFKSLDKDDQMSIKSKLPELKTAGVKREAPASAAASSNGQVPEKKAKKETAEDKNEVLFKYKSNFNILFIYLSND